jgi:hypothetical protein
MYVAREPGGLADTPVPVTNCPIAKVPDETAETVSVVPLIEPVNVTLVPGRMPPQVPAPQPFAYSVVSRPVLIWKTAVTEPPPVAVEEAAEAAVMVNVADVITSTIWNSPFRVRPPTALAPEKVTKSPWNAPWLGIVTVTVVEPLVVEKGLLCVIVARIGVIS